MPTSSYVGDVTTEKDVDDYLKEIKAAAKIGDARLKHSIELIAQDIERKAGARLHSAMQGIFHKYSR